MTDRLTPEYEAALKALNEAAYAALRASSDTTAMPHIDRQSLREIAKETDRLVDKGARSGWRE